MITIEEQLAEVQREIGKRQADYEMKSEKRPSGREELYHRIEVMRAVRDTLLAQSLMSKKITEGVNECNQRHHRLK